MGPRLHRAFDRALKPLSHLLPRSEKLDRVYHHLLFLWKHGRMPRPDNLMWNDVWFRLKTSGEILDPLRVYVTDKQFLKTYVRSIVGGEYVVPTLAILTHAAQVDETPFPDTCCIKPTHASSEVILRSRGEPLDRERIKSWFELDYYFKSREPHYQQLTPKVIVEPLVFGSTRVVDYKIFCYEGEPRIIQVDVNRFEDHRRKFFDTDWNELDFSIIYPRVREPMPRPETLGEMLSVARALSRAFSFVRIDLYTNNHRVLVGEITHCSDNAGGVFLPPSAEKTASEHMFS
jgi:hypothetical protein